MALRRHEGRRCPPILAAHPMYWPEGWKPEFRGQSYPYEMRPEERDALYEKLGEVGFDGLSPEERTRLQMDRSFHFCHFGTMM